MRHLCLGMVQAQRAPIKHTPTNRRPYISRQMLHRKATTIRIMPIPKLQTVPIFRHQPIHIIPIIKDR